MLSSLVSRVGASQEKGWDGRGQERGAWEKSRVQEVQPANTEEEAGQEGEVTNQSHGRV